MSEEHILTSLREDLTQADYMVDGLEAGLLQFWFGCGSKQLDYFSQKVILADKCKYFVVLERTNVAENPNNFNLCVSLILLKHT